MRTIYIAITVWIQRTAPDEAAPHERRRVASATFVPFYFQRILSRARRGRNFCDKYFTLLAVGERRGPFMSLSQLSPTSYWTHSLQRAFTLSPQMCFSETIRDCVATFLMLLPPIRMLVVVCRWWWPLLIILLRRRRTAISRWLIGVFLRDIPSVCCVSSSKARRLREKLACISKKRWRNSKIPRFSAVNP